MGDFTFVTLFVFMARVGCIQHAQSALREAPSLKSEYLTYLSKFGKEYEQDEWDTHYQTFEENYNFVAAESLQGRTYILKLNRFADIAWPDIQRFNFGLAGNPRIVNDGDLHIHTHSDSVELAAVVNWVEKGAVTQVKDQGACGSCWAFSSTGALESAYQIATGNLTELSEQELVNGTNGMSLNAGCDGGWMFTAFVFVKENGLATEESVPYTSYYGTGDGPSLYLDNALMGVPQGFVTGYSWVTETGISLMSAINDQPVSVAIEVSSMSFMLYSDGVLSQPDCGTNVNHAVLAVGYDTDSDQSYWLIKNSWSADWGDDGYIKLEMDSSQKYDTCAIAAYAFYPILS